MKNTKTAIKQSNLKALRPVFGNNYGENIKRFSILKSLFSKYDTYALFAEPALVANTIRWDTDLPGEILPYNTLDIDIQEKVKRVLRYYVDILFEQVKQYQGVSELVQTLHDCLEIPDFESIVLVGKRPVLTDWGFIGVDFNAKTGLIKKIVDTIPSPKVMLNLKVLELATKRPIFGAKVTIKYERETETLTTNEEGNVSFKNITPFDHLAIEINVSCMGYESKNKLMTSQHTVAEMIFMGNFPLISNVFLSST